LYGANVVIFEGIMAFASKEILEVRDGFEEDSHQPIVINADSGHESLRGY
jgi:hypothetical protein